MTTPILVTAAVIENNGKILCARRAQGQHLEGYWEFPGGKVEAKESVTNCLIRELNEEFGIESKVTKYLMETTHHYEDKSVCLVAFYVEHLSGDFELRDHDAIEWLPVDQLSTLKWAPADVPIVDKLIGLSA